MNHGSVKSSVERHSAWGCKISVVGQGLV